MLKTIKKKISELEDSLVRYIQKEAWRHKGKETTAQKVDAGDAPRSDIHVIGSLEGGEKESDRSNL